VTKRPRGSNNSHRALKTDQFHRYANKHKKSKYCVKEAYTTEEDAKKAFSAYKLLADVKRFAPPTNYYQCARCKFWHLTTQE